MKSSKPAAYYIENLTIDAWVFSVLPYLLKNRMRTGQEVREIYYFNNSKFGLWLANFTLWFAKEQLKRADFSQGETRDQDGNLVWMNTMKDVVSLHEDIKNNSEFQRIIRNCGKANSLNLFLGKWLMSSDLMTIDVFVLLKFVFFVRCIKQQENLNNPAGVFAQNVFLFMQERPWFVELAKFPQSKGIAVIPTGNFSLHWSIFLLQFDGSVIFVKELCKKVGYHSMAIQHKLKALLNRSNKMAENREVLKNDGQRLEKDGPRIALEYYGYLNFDSPDLFSDLFFLQGSFLSARDILIYFGLPSVPMTDKEWNEIRSRGMSAVVINPRATVTPHVPLFNHKRGQTVRNPLDYVANAKKDINHTWLRRYTADYYRRRNYWIDFITQHNVKMDITWFRYSPDHCAKIDALKNTGGIGIVYQRSYDFFVAPWTFTRADVVFGFSKLGANVGRDKNSLIPYYVVTGYLGDYRFGLLKKRASVVRNRLQSHGARKIAAYFDEHATNHPRWNFGYKETLKDYSFLFNKVLENPWFGLILKPKVPSTLRSRLGPISDLLLLAEKTGRCFVFDDERWLASYPPASASLGADLAIHGHLSAATAGIESALAGTPTLILDREGTAYTPLYNLLKEGQVIFKDVNHLWQACVAYWNNPDGIPGFADWSAAFDELDPFRDGRAAERMGTHLKWLIEGFKAGLPRETVLADAAERYCKMWGKDKVFSVNPQEMLSSLEFDKDLKVSV